MEFLRTWRQRSIFTASGLRLLYKDRQAVNPTEGNRTNGNMIMISALVAILMSALFSLMWVQNNESAFLKELNGVRVFNANETVWRIDPIAPATCSDGKGCATMGETVGALFKGTQIAGYELAPETIPSPTTYPATYLGRDGKPARQLLISTTIDGRDWMQIADKAPVVLALPNFRFTEADVYLNGRKQRTFYNSERLASVFFVTDVIAEELSRAPMRVEVSMQVPVALKMLVPTTTNADLTFLAQQSRYQKFTDMLAVKRTGAGKQLADIARIVLAVFSLLLFIFVDSSPESLGLALFMSFKAIGVAVSQSWLPDSILPPGANDFLRNFMLCFGDIMQFYFFTQLARIFKPNLKPWFLYGGMIALFYTLVVMSNSKALGVDWSFQFWKWRNISIGLLCMSVALSSAWYLGTQKLYARSAALIIAFSGTIVQVIVPIMSAFPGIYDSEAFRTFYNMFETHTPYVFALSTFINISTLENRVKMLSRQVINAKEIERELALGQTVQQSFLRLPEIPKTMGVDYFHKAALYVSGDIYFVNWDETNECLTLLINDVTGHGVQAALKASICSTIAESIWTEKQIRNSDSEESRLQSYDARLHAYLSKVANSPEMVSLVGGEFNQRTGLMTLYRANGVFPMYVNWESKTDSKAAGSGQTDAGWRVHVLPLKNREPVRIDMNAGGFIVLLSDGLIDTSRRMAKLKNHLEQVLSQAKEDLSETQLKNELLSFGDFAMSNDDRTLLIFNYKSPALQKLLGIDRRRRIAA